MTVFAIFVLACVALVCVGAVALVEYLERRAIRELRAYQRERR